MRSARADAIDSRDGGLQWPVMCWKSQALPATLSSRRPFTAPIPAYGAADIAHEFVTAASSFAVGDVIRRQRGRHAGNNIAYAVASFGSPQRFETLSTTQSNYFISKAGVSTITAVANFRNRAYGFWPPRSAAIDGARNSKSGRISKAGTVGIVRVRAETPWLSGKSAVGPKTYNLSHVGRGDDPVSLELWARCLEPELGYSGQDEILLRGEDVIPAGGGEVWHNGSTVGFYLPAVGWAILSMSGAISTMTPSKWQFQLRAAWAGDLPDAISPPCTRQQRHVAWWASPWKKVAVLSVAEFVMPSSLEPINIFTALRCISPDLGYQPGDQFLSNHACNFNSVCLPTIVVRGRRVLIPTASGIAILSTALAGGSAIAPAKWQFQIRVMG